MIFGQCVLYVQIQLLIQQNLPHSSIIPLTADPTEPLEPLETDITSDECSEKGRLTSLSPHLLLHLSLRLQREGLRCKKMMWGKHSYPWSISFIETTVTGSEQCIASWHIFTSKELLEVNCYKQLLKIWWRGFTLKQIWSAATLHICCLFLKHWSWCYREY